MKPRKVGHAGTLDPLATGVLVVALGRATRLVPYVQRMPKAYEAMFLLGMSSDTEDITGNLVESKVNREPTQEEIINACRRFVGAQRQRPPAYSALKVDGRRSYGLARAGVAVEHKERPVVIHRLEVQRYAYPELTVQIECGSGTYVRSLGRDIGEELDCGAVMSMLQRRAIGSFRIEDSVRLEAVSDNDDIVMCLRPAKEGVSYLPQVVLADEECAALRFGQQLRLAEQHAEEIAAMDGQAALLAVLTRTDKGDYRPNVNLVAQ